MGKNLSVYFASIPFFYDRLTWCVHKNKPMQTSEILFHLCRDPIVYVVFTLHIVFVVFMAYFVQLFEQKSKWDIHRISINGFACYMGFSCTYKPTNNANRLGAISVYFGGMLFSILLNTIIIKMYTTPMFNPQVKTIDKLIEGKFSLVGNAFAYQKIAEGNQVNIWI